MCPCGRLPLPLDYAAIEKILPHRYPFLLVDRITEFEVDKRIVGIKNISSNERYLTQAPDGRLVLPSTILTEAIAQVGAILILLRATPVGDPLVEWQFVITGLVSAGAMFYLILPKPALIRQWRVASSE